MDARPAAGQRPSRVASAGLRRVDAGPGERVCTLAERAVLDDAAAAEDEAVCEAPARPFGRPSPADPAMQVDDDLVRVLEPALGLAGAFRPAAAPADQMRAHLLDAAI